MNELDQFLKDFYDKYAAGTYSPEKAAAIKAAYGEDYDALVSDLYGKYKVPIAPDKLAKIKQAYGFLPSQEEQQVAAEPQDTGFIGAMKSMVESAQTPSDVDPSSRIDPMTNAWQRGMNLSETADVLSFDQAPDATEIARLQQEQAAIPVSNAYAKFNQAQSLGESLRALAENPVQVVGELFLESMAGQVGGWENVANKAAMGGGTGAAAGTFVLPGIGTAAGLKAGVSAGTVVGMAETSLRLEWAGKFIEALQEAGVNTQDQESLAKAFADDNIMAEARAAAYRKSIPIAIFDLISGGLAGRIVSKPAKSLIGKIGQGAAEFGVQAGLGGGGELAGQLTAGEDINYSSIIAEMVGEGATAPVEIGAGAMAYNQTRFQDPAIADAEQDIDSSGDLFVDADIDATYDKIAAKLDELELNPSVTQDDINKQAEDINSDIEAYSSVAEENELEDREYTPQEAAGIQAANLPSQSTQEINLDDSERMPALDERARFAEQESERMEFESNYTAEELAQMSEEDAAPASVRKAKETYERNQQRIKDLEAKKEQQATKKQWFWVTGSVEKGYQVTDRRPRGKNVMEPFESSEAAERGIAQLITDNSAYKSELETKQKSAEEQGAIQQVDKPKPIRTKPTIDPEERKQDRIVKYRAQLENIKKDKPGKQAKRLAILNEKTLDLPEINEQVRKQQEYLNALTDDKAFAKELRERTPDEKLDLIASRAGDESTESTLIGQIKARLAQENPKDGKQAIAALNELNALVDELKDSKLLMTEKSEVERLVRTKTKALEPIAEAELQVQRAEEEAAKQEKRTKQNDKDSYLVAIAKATITNNPVGIKQAIDDYLAWRTENKLATTDKRGNPIDAAFVAKQATAEIYVDKADKQLKREAEEAASKRRREAKDKKDQKKRIKSADEQKRLDQLKDELGLSDDADIEELGRNIIGDPDDFQDENAEIVNRIRDVKKLSIDEVFEIIKVAYPNRLKFLSGLKALILVADKITKRFTKNKGIEFYRATLPTVKGEWLPIGYHIIDTKAKRDIIIISDQFGAAAQGETAAHESIHAIVSGIIGSMRLVSKALGENSSMSKAFGTFYNDVSSIASFMLYDLQDEYVRISRKIKSGNAASLTKKQKALLALMREYTNQNNFDVDVYTAKGIDMLIADLVTQQPKLHYFLYDAAETLAEAFSNPYVAGILSIFDSKLGKTKGVTHSYFRQIYESLLAFAEKFLSTFGVKPAKNNYFDQLSNYMETMEKAFLIDATNTLNLDSIPLPHDTPNESLAESMAMINPNGNQINPLTPKLKSLINYLANSWYKRKDIVSLEGVEQELEKINARAKKNQFTQPEAVLLWRKIQKYRQLVVDAKASQANALAYAKAYRSEYKTSRTYRRDINDFASVDIDELTIGQVKILHDGIVNLAIKATPHNRAYNLVNKDVAVKKLNKLLQHAGKYGKNPGIFKISVSNLANPATFSAIMAKYNTKASQALFNEIFGQLMIARTHTLHETNYFTKGLFEIVNKYKLSHKDTVRAGMYGAIFSTQLPPSDPDYWTEVELNAARVVQNAQNKVTAYEREVYRGKISKKDIYKEVDIAQDLYNTVTRQKSMDNILTRGQQELYDELRSFSSNYEADMERNTEGVWGADFNKQFNYFPTFALGNVRLGNINGQDELIPSDRVNNLWEALQGNKNYGKIIGRQTGFSKEKVQPNNYFYDYDLMSIAHKFAPSTLFDLYASRELKILNQLINGPAGKPVKSGNKTIDDVLSGPAVKGLNKQLKSIVGGVVTYDEGLTWFFKFLTAAKNNTAVALLGTTGQFLVQVSSAVPAAIIMAPTGFPRALAVVSGIERGENHSALRETLDKLREKGASITMRDVLFERFQTIEDVNKEGIARGLGNWRASAEETTSLMLRSGDKLGARLVWFSEFFAQGGTLENPTEEAIMAAERAVGILQNMSDVAFSAPFLRTNHQAARILLQMLYAFQSFALNNALNLMFSTKYALHSGEARRVMLSSFMMAAAYNAVTIYLIRPGYFAIADSIFGTDEDDEEEKNYSKNEEFLWGTAWDLLVSQWAPSILEAAIKYYGVVPIMKRRAEAKGEEFNQFKDLPLYTPRNEAEVMSEAVGIYGDAAVGGVSLGGMLYQSMDNIIKGEELSINEIIINGVRAMLMFERAIPMRGDMQKLLRNYEKRVKQEERAMKQNNSGSPTEMEEVGTEFELPEYEIEIPEDPTELPEF